MAAARSAQTASHLLLSILRPARSSGACPSMKGGEVLERQEQGHHVGSYRQMRTPSPVEPAHGAWVM